ncbi:MAG: acyltransferase family protein [Duganella sp.]
MDRNLFVDYAKVAMALMVVAIHAGLFSDMAPPLGYLLTEGLFRMAVPVFFVFNGYYLGLAIHNQHATIKLVKRILVLYAIWMLVYAPFYPHPEGDGLRVLKDVGKLVLFGYYQLWYLIGLVYAVVLLRMTRKLGVPWLLILGLGLFGTATVLQYLNAYTDINLAVWKYRNGVLFGFPFVLAGYLLRTRGEHVSTRAAWAILAAGLCGLAVEALIAGRYARDTLNVDVYLCLILVAPAVAMLLVRSTRHLHTDLAAKLSTHIYLIHTLMITVAIAWFHLPRAGTPLFLAAAALSLLAFPPVYYLSRKLRFIL